MARTHPRGGVAQFPSFTSHTPLGTATFPETPRVLCPGDSIRGSRHTRFGANSRTAGIGTACRKQRRRETRVRWIDRTHTATPRPCHMSREFNHAHAPENTVRTFGTRRSTPRWRVSDLLYFWGLRSRARTHTPSGERRCARAFTKRSRRMAANERRAGLRDATQHLFRHVMQNHLQK